MTDIIVYKIISQPGGVDGLDFNNKGGTLVNALLSKHEATVRYGSDCRYLIEAEVLNLDFAKQRAMAKLDPIDRLALFGSRGKA